MASKVDMSLDDILALNKKKGPGKQFQGQGKPKFFSGGSGAQQNQNGPQSKVGDLRKVIADKQKANITDLRTKLKPKALYTSKFVSKQASKSNPSTPIATEGRPLKARPKYSDTPGPASKSRPRRSDPGPLSRNRPGSPKLPSYEEAKKITVTVPGTLRPTTSAEHRREERLAAAIARSRERRHDNQMKGREEFLASSITSALRESGGVSVDRDRGGIGGTFTRMQMRGYSRSPSPPLPVYHDPLPVSMSRTHVPSSRSGAFAPRAKEGITTLTSMLMQNLSDTVSRNDVIELCRAMGPLEAVQMVAPGVAEVVFKFKDDALEAYKKYNQRNLDGQPMVCRLQPTSRAKLTSGGYSGHRSLSQAYSDDLYSQPSSGFY